MRYTITTLAISKNFCTLLNFYLVVHTYCLDKYMCIFFKNRCFCLFILREREVGAEKEKESLAGFTLQAPRPSRASILGTKREIMT